MRPDLHKKLDVILASRRLDPHIRGFALRCLESAYLRATDPVAADERERAVFGGKTIKEITAKTRKRERGAR